MRIPRWLRFRRWAGSADPVDDGLKSALRALGGKALPTPALRAQAALPDTQRLAVYDAMVASQIEGKWFGHLNSLRDYVDVVVYSDWWRAHFSECRLIVAREARGQTRGAAGPLGGGAEGTYISLPQEAWYELYVLHEIAHCPLLGLEVEKHGPEYCRVFLDLVEQFMSRDDAIWLARFMRHRDIAIAPREGQLALPAGPSMAERIRAAREYPRSTEETRPEGWRSS